MGRRGPISVISGISINPRREHLDLTPARGRKKVPIGDSLCNPVSGAGRRRLLGGGRERCRGAGAGAARPPGTALVHLQQEGGGRKSGPKLIASRN